MNRKLIGCTLALVIILCMIPKSEPFPAYLLKMSKNYRAPKGDEMKRYSKYPLKDYFSLFDSDNEDQDILRQRQVLEPGYGLSKEMLEVLKGRKKEIEDYMFELLDM